MKNAGITAVKPHSPKGNRSLRGKQACCGPTVMLAVALQPVQRKENGNYILIKNKLSPQPRVQEEAGIENGLMGKNTDTDIYRIK